MASREELIDYISRYGGRCRDCADENGFCPSTGIGCGEDRKAIGHVFDAYAYGIKHGFITPLDAALPPGEDDPERCVICDERLEDGDKVYWSSNDDGHMHAECATSYVDEDGRETQAPPTPFTFKASEPASPIEVQAAQIARYEKRLEIDHHYTMGEGDELVRQETPPSEREAQIDGIECRDATIKELEAQIASLSDKVAEVERERDEARVIEADALKRIVPWQDRADAAEARTSELERENERLERENAAAKEAIRSLGSGLSHARAALQQEGE